MKIGTPEWEEWCWKQHQREYKNSLPHYVYIIANGLGAVKIGATDNYKRRLKELQHANAQTLRVIGCYTFPNRVEAMQFESFLHDWLSEYRIRGEWYDAEALKKFTHLKPNIWLIEEG